MAPPKKASGKNALLKEAINSGKTTAVEVIKFRERQRRKRAVNAAAAPAVRGVARAAAMHAEAPAIPARTVSLLGPASSSGILIAEGDSWFDYPFNDILQMLEDDYLFDVESVAHKGDCVEDMAHSKGQFEELARRLEKLLRAGKVPKAILLSGGGNDIVGDEFAILLNHAASSLPTLNEDIVRGVIDVRLRAAYASVISGLTEISKSYLDRPLPILTHGYDYPIPDGRGFMGGWWLLPGPWMRPGFERKGHVNVQSNAKIVAQLIDRFNEMLAAISGLPEFSHVHYVDLRNTLKPNTKHWANELHPTADGFELVTKKIANKVLSL